LETVVRVDFVLGSVTVTVAPGMNAPVESVTVPVTVPELVA